MSDIDKVVTDYQRLYILARKRAAKHKRSLDKITAELEKVKAELVTRDECPLEGWECEKRRKDAVRAERERISKLLNGVGSTPDYAWLNLFNELNPPKGNSEQEMLEANQRLKKLGAIYEPKGEETCCGKEDRTIDGGCKNCGATCI